MIDLNVVWNAYMAGYFDYCGTLEEAARMVERLLGLAEFSVTPLDLCWWDYPHFIYENETYSCYRFIHRPRCSRPVPL